MTRNRMLAIALLLLVGGGAGAYMKFFMRPPDAVRALPREGGDRPYTKVVEGPGHSEHMNGLEPVACKDCHILREDRFLKPDEARCQDCHERVPSTLHASAASRTGDVCTGCHQFLSEGGANATAWNCQRCHSQKQGELAAVQTHGGERCGVCHRPHDQEPTKVASCVGCHEHEKQLQARHGDQTGPQLCLDCHEPHGRAEVAAARCVTCHVDQQMATLQQNALESDPDVMMVSTVPLQPDAWSASPHGGTILVDDEAAPQRATGSATAPATAPTAETPAEPAADVPRIPATALFRGGHDACTKCHGAETHDFRAAAAKSCRGCHAGRSVIGEERVRAHGVCTSCHDSHNARANPVGACARCHSQVRPSHPQTDGGRCLGCHTVHPSQAAGPATRTCTSCHQEEGGETGNHAGGTRCTQCHRPHQFSGLGGGVCRGCHTNQAAQTAGNAGHQNCSRCHQAHEPSTPPAQCSSCHETESRTRPRGHRFECERCHEQHSGRQRASCEGCHADRTQMLHGSVQGGCTTCHRAHGPGGRAVAPACATCHNRASLPNLHSVGEHGQCRSCHVSGHARPRATRAVCTACHEDQQTHEPQASLCSGCHTFGASQ